MEVFSSFYHSCRQKKEAVNQYDSQLLQTMKKKFIILS